VRQAQARLAATLSNPLRTLGPTFYEISCVIVRFSCLSSVLSHLIVDQNCTPIYCEVLTADEIVHSIYQMQSNFMLVFFFYTKEISISVNTSVRDLIEKMSEKLRLPFHYLEGYHLFARVADSNSLFRMPREIVN
jgi:hypothetical protein